MHSWWDLGEGHGIRGSELALYQIQCAFCREQGNFELAYHAQKKKPNSQKRLNFDVYKCGNCAAFIHVFWSASEHSRGHSGIHDYLVLPPPLGIAEPPKHWPEQIQRYWKQAHSSMQSENWDAAAVMARSALQAALRDHQGKGKNLKEEIDNLAEKGILPPIMKDWSNELRLLGNESAHPTAPSEPVKPDDIKDTVEFLDYLLKYLYNLPKQIADYRNRRKENQ